jgi:hypothetical protein
MLKLLSAIAGVALVVGAIVALPGVIESVSASTPLAAGTPQVAGTPEIAVPEDAAKKGDRLDRVVIAPPSDGSCAQQGWPYYNQTCIARPAQPGKPPRNVRVITPDRP